MSAAIQQWSSANCMVLLVEPWSQPGSAAQDDGVRLLTDVHGLHAAYKQVLEMLNVAYTTVSSGSLQARLSQVSALLEERCHSECVAT